MARCAHGVTEQPYHVVYLARGARHADKIAQLQNRCLFQIILKSLDNAHVIKNYMKNTGNTVFYSLPYTYCETCKFHTRPIHCYTYKMYIILFNKAHSFLQYT